jgi:hypothetical protein
MVRQCRELEELETKFACEENLTIAQRFRLQEALYQEAVLLGAFPPEDPLEGIEICIRVAQAVNRVH